MPPVSDSPSRREVFGHLPDGRPVTRFRLGDDDGVALNVLDLGCVVQELWVPNRVGRRANVVLGCSDVEGYLRTAGHYFGAVVGRYANRIAGARLTIDGATYCLSPNDGSHTLHGGPGGCHTRLWTVERVDKESITLSLVSADGDQGFPGELFTTVTYEVAGDEVRIGYSAESSTVTVLNLTQHAHFNLRGEGAGSVETHLLQVAASRYTPVGPDLIPTGELADVAGSDLDLRRPREIGKALRSEDEQVRRGRGYDHNYVLDGRPGEPAAVLSDPVSGRTLEVSTDQPGLQVYTGNVLDGTQVGTSGRAYRQGDGVALETQHFPDSPRHEGEPDWPSVVLRPGQSFESRTAWRFRAE